MNRSSTGQHVVLVGGGHAHVHVLKDFGMRPIPAAHVTLVARDVETPYSGMLPGHVAGLYSHAECHIDLLRLAAFAGTRFIHAEAAGIDRAERRLLMKDGRALSYDLLSIDIGSTARFETPGAAEHTVPVRPVEKFLQWLHGLTERAERERLRIVVVGGGAGGVELILSLQHRLASGEGGSAAHAHGFALITEGRLMKGHNAAVGRAFRRILEARGIAVHEETGIARVESGMALTKDGRSIALDEAIWVTGPGAFGWLTGTGLQLDDQGFIAVDETLRSVNDQNIFAAGDIATILAHPRPKAGVFAVRAGPPLAENLRSVARGEPPKRFKLQSQALALIGTGERYAVGSWGPFKAEGRWLWRLKERIDRRWIARYQNPPS